MTKSDETLPEKFDLRSLDIAADKRAELLRLFPECATEGGKVDFDRLKGALGEQIDAGRERYGLTWPGKAACFETIQRPSLATLRPKVGESVAFDTTQNLILEGDNLEVLKLLQKSYLGKVKMIYIDPPYNTGNDFIYPDNFSESLQTYLEYTGQVDGEGRKFSTNTEADGRFHSKWLNMMYPRLYLARNLLREDGVIFISIDDHEVENLRRLCDEVFGESCFVACFIWQHSLQPKGYAGTVSLHHNYLLCYSRVPDHDVASLTRRDEHNRNYSNPDSDPKGPWRSGDVRNALFRPRLRYNLPTPSGGFIAPPEKGWRWSPETMQSKIATGEIRFSDDETRIIRKIYLSNVEGRVPESIWFAKEVGSTRDAANQIKALFEGATPFDTVKPTAIVERMLEVGNVGRDDIILDFFAGSGTTAHAVLEQNDKDGGNRKFILVQLPEPTDRPDYPTIADITKERVRRVIQKLNDADKDQLRAPDGPKPDRGFRVYQLATSNFKPWDGDRSKDAAALQQQLFEHEEHILDGRSEQDLLYEILLKDGFELTTPIETTTVHGFRVHSIAGGELLLCLEDKLTHELITTLADKRPSRVVFLDRGFRGNDQLKTNAAKLFASKAGENFQKFKVV